MKVLRIKDIKELRNCGNNKAYDVMHNLPYIFDGSLGVYKDDYEEYCNKEREKAREAYKARQNKTNIINQNYGIRKLS